MARVGTYRIVFRLSLEQDPLVLCGPHENKAMRLIKIPSRNELC